MPKLENISALLVATNSTFTKEAAFTAKTTRAELIRMLQAADSAVSEALETLERNKEDYSAEVQELNGSIGELENKLERETKALENLAEHAVTLEQEIEYLKAKYSEQQAKLVDAIKELADSKHYVATLQHQIQKYEQQGFFARLFGRTPK